MFKLLSSEEKAAIAPGLRNEGRFRMISDNQGIWVLKHTSNSDNEKRDLLGFLLGKDFCNIAKVRLLTEQELEEIKSLASQGESFNINNTFLVRLGHSYRLEELPCKTLEETVASEFVYSVWIRRRDAHIENRVYVNGIPIFFDFHIAFLGEPELANIDVFFSQIQDHGRAGLWRIKIWSNFLPQLTGTINNVEIGAFHFINDTVTFYKNIEKIKDVIKNNTSKNIDAQIREVKFHIDHESEIIEFLKKNAETLDSDVEKMIEIIGKD